MRMMRSLVLFALAILGGGVSRVAMASCAGAATIWHNLSDNGPQTTSPGIASGLQILNTNIDIRGRNAINDFVKVVATTCDILITITNEDSIITGSGNRADGILTSSARMYLFAGASRTITFSIVYDLMFRGTANGSTLLDLLVTVSGPGSVNFLLDGKSVTFTSLASTGGARVYNIMDAPVSGQTPDMLFKRMSTSNVVDRDCVVGIGPRSLMGFASQQSIAAVGGLTDAGTIGFDTGNTGTGRLVLRLDEAALLNISGRFLDSSPGINGLFLIGDIDQKIPAGRDAKFEVTNSSLANGGGLLVINKNNLPTNLLVNPWCDGQFAVTGTQFGFILGGNGIMTLNNGTYLDYVGTRTNIAPLPNLTLTDSMLEAGLSVAGIVKDRNPSAFIVDDNATSTIAIRPLINMLGSSAVYLRSGVDEEGAVQEKVANAFSFTVNPNELSKGPGSLVFSVEGDLDVRGSGTNALHILSLEVTPTGGPVYVRSGETTFPLRTFATNSSGVLRRYNKAYAQINQRMYLDGVSIVHDDDNHTIYEKDDIKSEPTYVGGDKFRMRDLGFCSGGTCSGLRPKIVFARDSVLRVHKDVAFTGLDLLVTNSPSFGNSSTFIFYHNGRRLDAANGRHMILGTNVGSFASDGGTIVDRASHLDVIQERADASPLTHKLTFTTQPNDTTVNNQITTALSELMTQASIHTIYLGHTSNISVGTVSNDFLGTGSACNISYVLTTTPNLFVQDVFFSLETRGGTKCYPETSGVTGEGGIFVDTNGLFDISPTKRMNIAAMVTKSKNGRVSLPRSQVFFDKRVGIADWRPDMGVNTIMVPAGSSMSDYTMDWVAVSKDYSSSTSLVPYELSDTPTCGSQAVRNENLRKIPEVFGNVEQFQIKRSRLGDAAHLKVGRSGYQSGFIKELVYLSGFDSAEAPVAVLVLEGDARVGLGSASRNADSVEAAAILGINGVTIIANGNGEIMVNDHLTVNNVCHLLSGTNFGTIANGQQFLSFVSESQKEIRVKNGGILDLSSFTSTNQTVEFSGDVRLVLETGSTVILGGTLQFSGRSQLIIQRTIEDAIAPLTLASTDTSRAKIVGVGEIRMLERSRMIIPEEAALGIETMPDCVKTTSVKWTIQDAARIEIGSDAGTGGAWQIGNTTNRAGDNTITFSLIMNGIESSFEVGQAGFLGLGAGVVFKDFQQVANNWTIGSLFNISSININIPEGTFISNNIVDGTSRSASLIALGGNSDAKFTFTFNAADALILGGANIIKIAPSVTSLTPTVTSFTGVVSSSLKVGILSSKDLLLDPDSPAQPVNVSADTLFDFLRVRQISDYRAPRADIAVNSVGSNMLGYVAGATDSTIFRVSAPRIIGERGAYVDPRRALGHGAVGITLNILGGTYSPSQVTEYVGE